MGTKLQKVSAFEAKTKLSELLRRQSEGGLLSSTGEGKRSLGWYHLRKRNDRLI